MGDTNHAVIADCTAAEFIAKQYPKWLKMGINVVTPNKKAGSADMKFYREVQDAARTGGVEWGYEATVGAALPVILTIQDFKKTGDEISMVQGIFSGTLSYIFNVMSATGRDFSDVLLRQSLMASPSPTLVTISLAPTCSVSVSLLH